MLDIFMKQGPEIRKIYLVYRRILRWLKAQGLELQDVRNLALPGEFLTVDQGLRVPALNLKVYLSFYIPDVGNIEPHHREFDKGFVTLVVELEGEDGGNVCWFSSEGGYAACDVYKGSWLDTAGDELHYSARRQPHFMLDLVKRVAERYRK